MQSLHHPTIIHLPFSTPHPHTLHFPNHFSSTIFTHPHLRHGHRHLPSPAAAVSPGSLWEKGPIEGVLFDIDGTLCDSDPLHFYAFRQMLQQVGFNNGVPISEEFFIENISGRHNEDLCGILLPNWDLPKARKFLLHKEAYFCRLAAEQLKAIEGLDKVCKWIEERGIKRAAVTNAPRPNAELILSMLKLTDFFQVVIIGNECERAKPFPDPYLKALQALQLSPRHSFVFEDSVSGVKAGVGAGMRVVGVGRRNPQDLLIEAGASFVIQDFNDPNLWTQLLF
ncbi:haloacid dehalogenase-like hydrolase domain-containing protein Sgpp [Benincasa hispida]|uniref:haloacid dehalogenase-like hydrolase domain-containing protein Sgpp n=1 Tax=Benincasa hispida TaxID=102211 RepID=UPI0018FF129D|nr:haloacid dehalogenase-like hydrolase domain-containing protein Sgpp [Benincasa hispida]